MAEQGASTEVTARIEQATAQLRIPSAELVSVPQQLADIVAHAGLQSPTGTVAFAGQYASGSFAVQYNDQNGGFSSAWPQWAFELAKAALLANILREDLPIVHKARVAFLWPPGS